MTKEEVLVEIENLSTKSGNDAAEQSIERLVSIEDEFIDLLIHPGNDKSLWENAAIVLSRIGYPRIKHVIPHLLRCLQDVNWPGTKTIVNLLSQTDATFLIPHLRTAILEAYRDEDYLWLGGLKMLVKKHQIAIDELGSIEFQRILDRVDWC